MPSMCSRSWKGFVLMRESEKVEVKKDILFNPVPQLGKKKRVVSFPTFFILSSWMYNIKYSIVCRTNVKLGPLENLAYKSKSCKYFGLGAEGAKPEMPCACGTALPASADFCSSFKFTKWFFSTDKIFSETSSQVLPLWHTRDLTCSRSLTF